MNHMNEESKTFKLFTALRNGDAVSAAQARKRFGIKNLAAEASRIRQRGFAVYSTTRTAGNGVNVTEYTLGRPSRDIVALGYKAKAMGITL